VPESFNIDTRAHSVVTGSGREPRSSQGAGWGATAAPPHRV